MGRKIVENCSNTEFRGRNVKAVHRAVLGLVLALTVLVPLSAGGEEGGSGHYMPGMVASFIDALPGKPGLAVGNFFNYYSGNASLTQQLPFGGMGTFGLSATAYSDTIVALHETPLRLLGGHYTVGVAIPYVWMEVKGDVPLKGPGGETITRSVRDSANGFGDVTFYPFMLGWTGLNGDLKYDIRLGVYAPTGAYQKGKLANVGKNFWTVEPGFFLSYISSKTHLQFTTYAGVDFNTENSATDYRSGSQFHLDFTVAQHLPLLGGIIGIGATGFYYQQVSGDSGSGAILGDCRGRTLGIGPVLSYTTTIRGKDFAAEAKWLPEMNVEKRLKGDYVWIKLAIMF